MGRGNDMDPILIEVPIQIETDRLILREPHQAGDGNGKVKGEDLCQKDYFIILNFMYLI